MTTIRLVGDCLFTRGRSDSSQYMVLDNGLVQRVYGMPPELIPDCATCGVPTVIEGAIIGKHFYGNRKLHVWCKGHVPWWIGAGDAVSRWGWKLFGIPAHKWPW